MKRFSKIWGVLLISSLGLVACTQSSNNTLNTGIDRTEIENGFEVKDSKSSEMLDCQLAEADIDTSFFQEDSTTTVFDCGVPEQRISFYERNYVCIIFDEKEAVSGWSQIMEHDNDLKQIEDSSTVNTGGPCSLTRDYVFSP